MVLRRAGEFAIYVNGRRCFHEHKHCSSNRAVSLTVLILGFNRNRFAGDDKMKSAEIALVAKQLGEWRAVVYQSWEVRFLSLWIFARSLRPHSDGDSCKWFLKNRLKSCTRL
jgi:hypothetical protein